MINSFTITASANRFARKEIHIQDTCIFDKEISFFELRSFIRAFIRQKKLDATAVSYFDIGTIIGMPSNCNDLTNIAIKHCSNPGVINGANTLGHPDSIEKGIAYMTLYYKPFCSPTKKMSSESSNNINSIW